MDPLLLTMLLFLLSLLIVGFLLSLVTQFLRLEKRLKALYIFTETEVRIFFENGAQS